MRIPVVAIIGKPNVGKSVLFNRILKGRFSVVSDIAGTTRDRVMREVETKRTRFVLVDTAGLGFDEPNNSLDLDIKNQANIAVRDADIILFLIDSKKDITNDEYNISDILRRNKKKSTRIITVLTKCDTKNEDIVYEKSDIFRLGFDRPILVSSIHNFGVTDLLNEIEKEIIDRGFKKYIPTTYPNIAVLGKPNVGKSSLVNGFLSQPKLIVSDIPGTTIDSTDTKIIFNNKTYNFIDTAGIRRKGKIKRGIEKYSIMRTLKSLHRSDIVLMVVDGSDTISKQDQHIAGDIIKQNKGLVLVVNKCDLQEEGDGSRAQYIGMLRRKFSFIAWVPVIFISAKNKTNLHKIFPLIENIVLERDKRIKTSELNSFVSKMTMKHIPTGTKNILPRIYYVTQTGINPPEFVFFVNNEQAFHFSYRRYMENRIRETFGFNGTSIKIIFKPKTI